MATITVHGTATAQVQPDYVIVTLGVSHLAADAPAALQAVAERSERLAALLADMGLERSAWVTEGVNVSEEYEWRNDTNVLVGYRATAGVAATIRSVDKVGALLRDAVGTCQASVRALSWRVDADNPMRRTLLGSAAADARARAEAYADALDLRLGAIEAVSDDVIVDGGGGSRPEMSAYGAGLQRSKADVEVSVSGGLIELAADVYVRFATRAG